jgi:Leucine-rich repeat (LRR) protein
MCSTTIFAQDKIINIPDANFKNALLRHYKTIDTNNDGEIQKSEAEAYTEDIDLQNMGITDLTGIEYFVNMTKILCQKNSLNSLNLSKNTALVEINCYMNPITELNVSNLTSLEKLNISACSNLKQFDITECTALKELYCGSMRIEQLDVSKNVLLTYLNCNGSNLKQLDVSSNTALTTLNCNLNMLEQLDISNNVNLVYFVCDRNNLTQLDVSKNTSLRTIIFNENNLTELDVTNNQKLTMLNCGKNRLTFSNIHNIKSKIPSTCIFQCHSQGKIFEEETKPLNFEIDYTSELDINGNTTVFTWYNATNDNEVDETFVQTIEPGKFKFLQLGEYYCKMTNAVHSIVELQTNTISIITEEIVNIPDINFKNALLNHSKTIDTNNDGEIQKSEAETYKGEINVQRKYIKDLTGIEAFINITALNCSKNELNELDVTKNIHLTELNCYSTQITELDVSKNVDLTILKCNYNQIRELDLSKNIKLEYVNSTQNVLTSLNTSKCLKLKELYLDFNKLTAIDITNSTSLISLGCGYNEISSLDVTKNVNLTKLYSSSNKLSNLDLTKNTKLEVVSFGDNNLSSIDLSNNTKLKEISCSKLDIEQLNLSSNTLLTKLNCKSCKLTELDLSKNTALTDLNCSLNKLTNLDLTSNTDLKELECNSNQLTNLNLALNTALKELDCSHNNLKGLDITNNTSLEDLDCSNMNNEEFKILDLSKNIKLEGAYCNASNLTQINLPNSDVFRGIDCSGNKLSELDLSPSPNLDYLKCTNNELTGLDLSANVKLERLFCDSNRIAQLDLSKLEKLRKFDCSRNLLKLSELWAVKSNLSKSCFVFIFSPQKKIFEETTVSVNKELDYTTELTINSKTTVFSWYNATDNSEVDETFVQKIADGKFKILKSGKYYCKMTNVEFDGLELQTKTITVLKAQTLTFDVTDVAKVNDKITLEATASTGLDVTYQIVSGEATLDGNILTPTAEGTLVVKAIQAGNDEYALVEKEVTIQVTKRDQTITFDVNETVKVNDKITLAATASSGLDVTYQIISGNATLDGNTVTFTDAGKVQIKAKQAGNNEYNAAEKTVTITVTKSTAIDNLSVIGAKIYPNPVNDILNIELPTTGSYTVTVFNTTGDIVTQKTIQSVNTTIDMSVYNNGIYIIKVTTGNRSYTGKIIKR